MSRSDVAKRLLGPRWTVRARCLLRGKPLPRWGNLRRTRPLSENYGADRGTPVDRYYLDKFLTSQRHRITGRVLEIQGSSITSRYGQALSGIDTIDIDPRFNATYTCDWVVADTVVPAGIYDCVLLPNTLHHLRDIRRSLAQAMRVLKPGGSLVATACGFVPLIPDGPDYWRLGEDGWRQIALEALDGYDWSVEGHGNCLSAVAALMGVAAEELDAAELDVRDPRYPVLVTLCCARPRS